MLNATEAQKKVFYDSGYFNNYILTFPEIGLVIDNETIHSETPVIQESICDEADFTLGGCIASSLEFEVSEILADQISGLECIVQIQVRDEDGRIVFVVPMGTFRIDKSEQIDDQDYKKVTAYDRMYDASVEVIEWYQQFFADGAMHTVKEVRESLLTYLGIPFVIQNLPNDDVCVEKTIETTSIQGTDMLRLLCVLNGGFGRMNRHGEFEVMVLRGLSTFPEDNMGEFGNLYPSETLYPEDSFEYIGMSDGENIRPEYHSTRYEEYMTMPITCLNIQTDAEDIGVTIGEDLSNPYRITDNYWLFGKSAEELKAIGENIFAQIKGVTYRPNTTELDGLPYLEVGDIFALEKRNDTVESYIFSRTLSGIQALIDTFEAKGNKVRANEVSASNEIMQLKGKTLKISKSVDALTAEMEDLEEETKSQYEQTASSIVLKVDSKGRIVQAALTTDPEEGATFQVDADNINLSAEDVMQLMSNGTLDLTGKNIKITSDNFTVEEDGTVVAKAICIEGGEINLQSSYSGTDQIILQHLTYDGFGGEIKYYGEGHPEETETEAGGNGDMYLDLLTGTIYVWTQLGGWLIARPLANDSYSWEVVSMNSESGLTTVHKNNVLLQVEGEDGKYHDELFTDETEFSFNSSGIHTRKTTHDTAMGIVRTYEHEGDITLEENGVDESNNPQYKLVSTDPVYAPNIGKFQTVSVSSSGTVKAGESVTLSFSVSEVEGAAGYIAVPQTWSWCCVSRLSMNGAAGSVTLLNTSGAAHTLSATLLIMAR